MAKANKKPKNNLPFFERPDLSPFLVHLTRRSKKPQKNSAFENLISILKDGHIKSSGPDGFIKGYKRATCFMDTPLSSLKYVLNERDTKKDNPRYEPYGIVITKKNAFKKGCRPVMYLSKKEEKKVGISQHELWRVVQLNDVNGFGVNWIHEREWRCEGSYKLPKAPIAVLVKTAREAKKLRNIIEKKPSEFRIKPQSIIPLSILCQGLPYMAK
ncbi:hypothetical protein [Pseudomonas sp. PH1b]|uniref:hypothetical protein n=1 Tax=Pseudomonas sp. PH1b TaxID=1397282 RepID=UPI0012FEFE76|nr:hypothetical protein [Pseudomonas sp. PH1b]